MSMKEKKLSLIQRLKDVEGRDNSDSEKLNRLIKDTVNVLEEDVNKNENDQYNTISQTAEQFNVTPQAVHKWMKKGKIDYEIYRTPGGKRYRIPKKQFDGNHIIEKRMAQKEKLQEAREKVNWNIDNVDDLYPVGNEEDKMEELDID